MPSNTKFGLFFSLVLFTTAIYCYSQLLHSIAFACFIGFFIFFTATFLFPMLLTPLNQAWYFWGVLLGRIINPFILGIFFFVVLTPIALITRTFGRDELKIKKLTVQSYWVDRNPSGPSADSFKDQF